MVMHVWHVSSVTLSSVTLGSVTNLGNLIITVNQEVFGSGKWVTD